MLTSRLEHPPRWLEPSPGQDSGSIAVGTFRPTAPETFDVRLALGAVVAWVAVLAARNLSVRTVYITSLVAAGLGLAALAADRIVRPASAAARTGEPTPEHATPGEEEAEGRRRGSRRFAAAAALACFCSAGTLWSLGAHLGSIRSGPVPALVARRAAGVFTVTGAGDTPAVVSSISFAPPRGSNDATMTDLRSGAPQ